jgi:multicomponent Na+:H+ antiporter subunit G
VTGGAVLDLVGAVLAVLGAVLSLTAAIGLLRLPDVLSRMHAATKPQVVGLVLVLVGAALHLRSSVDVWMLLLTGAFALITAPVTAHMVGRLAHRTGGVRRDLLHTDDLADDLARHEGEPPAGDVSGVLGAPGAVDAPHRDLESDA